MYGVIDRKWNKLQFKLARSD